MEEGLRENPEKNHLVSLTIPRVLGSLRGKRGGQWSYLGCISLFFISDKFYNDCSHFWPLESAGNIEDVITHTWGVASGGVHTAAGLQTDGVSGKIQLLDREGTSCATKLKKCSNDGFTIALRFKYFNRADGQKQVFFTSFGKFVIYQERNDSLNFRVERPTLFCEKKIEIPERIWSYLVFTYKSTTPKTLTVYRNGKQLSEFLRNYECNSEGQPQFPSSSVSLGAGLGKFAKASFDDVAIWNHVLSDQRIGELSKANTGEFRGIHF